MITGGAFLPLVIKFVFNANYIGLYQLCYVQWVWELGMCQTITISERLFETVHMLDGHLHHLFCIVYKLRYRPIRASLLQKPSHTVSQATFYNVASISSHSNLTRGAIQCVKPKPNNTHRHPACFL